MSYMIAAECCQTCYGVDDEERQLYWKVKFSEQLDVAMRSTILYLEEGYIDEEQYQINLVFNSNLLTICFECNRKKPKAFLLIKKSYIRPLKKKLREERVEQRKLKEKSKNETRRVVDNVYYLRR